ncbi:MAG: hypothetical protein STSR0007_12340 [Thermovirga sp.]
MMEDAANRLHILGAISCNFDIQSNIIAVHLLPPHCGDQTILILW